jgi:CheY-like chemotaxis protein
MLRHCFALFCLQRRATVRPGDSFSLHMSQVALVVDDSMLIRYTVCRFLEERGYTVESATNGAEALDILSRIKPDLIFTDMQMPKMSGSELITALKSKPETATVPIIIVAARASGFAESEKRANYVIFKDIDIETQLAKALDAVCKATRAHAAGK